MTQAIRQVALYTDHERGGCPVWQSLDYGRQDDEAGVSRENSGQASELPDRTTAGAWQLSNSNDSALALEATEFVG